MLLFSENRPISILPHDGIVNYHGVVFSIDTADQYYNLLLNNVNWKNDEAIVFGKHFVTPRKVAWYGDEHFPYTYSNTTKEALPWTAELVELKKRTEEITGTTFNSCLLNLYHNGSEGMAWHSDGEKALLDNGTIASLSFGAERKFSFKHKETKQVVSLTLENGSLLVMKDQTQKHWLHRLPTTTKINSPRINLTFRTIVTSS